jgi:hypothetical protein
MKKILSIVLLVLLFGCASTPKAPDDLDLAIRDASDYLNENIPARSKIVILNIQSDYVLLSDYIIDELIANAVNDRIFTVVDRAQLEQIRMELNFQMSGEVDDKSALEIGKFLGAQTIVSGAISEFGDRYRMRIRALNVLTAQVQGQYNRNITAGKTIADLKKGGKSKPTTYGGRTASGNTDGTTGTSGSGSTGGNTSGTGARTTTPTQTLKNGTYTMNPRPRVREAGGNWVNMWVTKVVVEPKFITFYFDNREKGAGKGVGESASVDWQAGAVTLYNLDKPSVFVKSTGMTNSWDPETITFPRIDCKRFRIETLAHGRDKGIDEIILGEPDDVSEQQPPLKNGTYTMNPRPRVREAGGTWVNMWITKVVVEPKFITFYFDNRERGTGKGEGESADHDWATDRVTLYNLDNQNVFVKSTGGDGTKYVVFPRIDCKRFKMETIAFGRDKGIEVIILGEPDAQ